MKIVQAKVEILGKETVKQSTNMTVHFTVDRGVSYELARHLPVTCVKESIPSGNSITIVEPVFFHDIPEEEKDMCRQLLDDLEAFSKPELMDFLNNKVTDRHKKYARWYESCEYSEHNYFAMLELGATPEEARTVLPNSLKTEVLWSASLQGWLHFFELMAGKSWKHYSQIEEVMTPLLKECQELAPEVFGDIHPCNVPDFLPKCMNIRVEPDE